MSDADVNKKRTGDAQPGMGHNNPPPDIYVREIKKLTAIEAVLKNPKFTQTQALILIGLIVRSSEDYSNAFPGGTTLAIYAKVKRTDAVFKALRELEDQFKVIHRESRGQGKSNAYTVLPQRILDEVVTAYEERKAAKAAEKTHPPKAGDHHEETTTLKAGGISEPTRLERAPAQTGHPPKAGTTHPPKAGTYPVSIRSVKKDDRASQKPNFWQNVLNPSHGVLFEDGKITLQNGMRVTWLERFDNDAERLDLALEQAAAFIEPNSPRPLETQVSAQLARQVAEKLDRDKRYAAAAKSNPARNPTPKKSVTF